MLPEDVDAQIEGIAALRDPVRRALYRHVLAAGTDVSREEAGEAAGISRGLAAFHLDKLVEEGLLETSFRRLSGRSGPGAGRPAKLYRRSPRQLELTLPPRDYELAARLFADALDADDDRPPQQRLRDRARDLGRRLGERARTAGRSRAARLEAARAVLREHGYEPDEEGRATYLRNCPFDTLARDHLELVCGMNLAVMEGVLEGMGAPDVEATLDPQPGRCCVVLSGRTDRPRRPPG